MVLCPHSGFVGFLRVERYQASLLVEVVDAVGDKAFETVTFDPLGEVFRKEVLLILIVSDEVGRRGGKLT